jgi:hypothetical protein
MRLPLKFPAVIVFVRLPAAVPLTFAAIVQLPKLLVVAEDAAGIVPPESEIDVPVKFAVPGVHVVDTGPTAVMPVGRPSVNFTPVISVLL